MTAAYEADDAEPQTDPMQPSQRLQEIVNFRGNLAEALPEDELIKIGAAAVREWGFDKTGRSEWEDAAKKALKLATQKIDKKNTPFPNASNIHYPILTTASIQFAARAYPALIKGDEVLTAKVVGADPLGLKAQRAQRLTTFTNDQIMYECTEWEPGTDALLHALPIVGHGFRKGAWSKVLDRPRLDYASALDVYAPIDAPSLDDSPRVTQRFERYPFQVAQMIKAQQWANHRYEEDGADDSQKPCEYIEQHRYMDLDGDGLEEPYIVTVETENEKVVRIDPAFDPRDMRVGETGEVEAVTRLLPWVDYTFLPDPEGGLYGMGFGKLLESLQSAIDTALNQMMDAGHLANSPGGFIGQGLNIRGGTYRIEPGLYRFVNAPGKSIAESIYTHQFAGPSPVLFQLVDLLLAGAKDITAVKDVLTGEAPGQQPATSTLALIEQGLAVFTAIYKRIYRSLRREYKLLFALNARYLSAEHYRAVLDQPLQQPKLPQGAPPMPPAAQQELQQELQRGVTPQDFASRDYDIRPVADPAAVTQMQQLSKAQLLREFKGDPTVNQQEINKRIFDAAHIPDTDALLNVPPNPMADLEMKAKAADVAKTEAETAKMKGEASKIDVETKGAAFDEGVKQGAMGGMAGQPGDGMVSDADAALGGPQQGDGAGGALGQPTDALAGAQG